MARTLSPIQNAILSAGWALLVVLVVLLLAHFAGLTLNNQPFLYGLLFLGPVVSAAFCRRLSGVLLGAVGFGAGVLLGGLIATLSVKSMSVAWTRAAILIPLVAIGELLVSIPLWWCVRRFQRVSAQTASTP
jgi:hypothetical protein